MWIGVGVEGEVSLGSLKEQSGFWLIFAKLSAAGREDQMTNPGIHFTGWLGLCLTASASY